MATVIDGDMAYGYLIVCYGKSPFLLGKPSYLSSINGPFSIAMFNNKPTAAYLSGVDISNIHTYLSTTVYFYISVRVYK
jgi:hypothetical protein